MTIPDPVRPTDLGENALLAWDVLQLKPARGIPSWMLHTLDVEFIEKTAGHAPGDFARDPEGVYVKFQKLVGSCFNDQFIPENVLSMGSHGYRSDTARGATTGVEKIVLDGMEIDSPEAAIEHMERFVFPKRQKEIAEFPSKKDALIRQMIEGERRVQALFGGDILKGPYGWPFQSFPGLSYGSYGYANYFMAYALFPEVMERDFALQADLAVLRNRAAAEAILKGNMPRMLRLDHDMADSRGTLVDIRSLDRIWFPHFARSIQPYLDAGIRLIWHCDGNLMQMVPRLLECGLGGFQGFQYEDGMDYEAICRMTTRDGDGLLIIAGLSVTRTMPFGTRQDVIDEAKWLVEKGPRVGLMLAMSSSLAPGVPHENLRTAIEALNYYREHGRG